MKKYFHNFKTILKFRAERRRRKASSEPGPSDNDDDDSKECWFSQWQPLRHILLTDFNIVDQLIMTLNDEYDDDYDDQGDHNDDGYDNNDDHVNDEDDVDEDADNVGRCGTLLTDVIVGDHWSNDNLW